jgi:glutamate--cysteine ligase
VPRHAFKATIEGRTVLEVARDLVAIARGGLKRRARKGALSPDESGYLDTLDETVAHGRTPAEDLLDAYATRWERSVDPVFRELAY